MNDDLDNVTLDGDDAFDDFGEQKKSKGGQNPIVKVVVVGVVAVVFIGAVLYFGGGSEEEAVSRVTQGPDIESVPATGDQITPAYKEAIDEQNEADLEAALRQSTSAIPVIVNNEDNRLNVPEPVNEEEDPLQRWRKLQEERVERQLKVQEVEVEPVTVLDAEQQSEAINALSQSMAQQMESILSASTVEKQFTSLTLLEPEEDEEESLGSAGGGLGGTADSAFVEDSDEIVIVSAGTVVYGQLLLEANSDVPSRVLAQVVSGALKGWKLLGEFSVIDELNLLAISFETAVNDEGKTYDIDAVMLNPDTSLAAMRSDVDYRYMRRIVLPAAASFVDGFASAIAESGRTSVTVTGETVTTEEAESTNDQEVALGVEEAAGTISEILDEMADVPVKVIIASGTPIGVFFTENVVDEEDDF